MSKYNEVMEKVKVSKDMRDRILSSVEKELEKGADSTVSIEEITGKKKDAENRKRTDTAQNKFKIIQLRFPPHNAEKRGKGAENNNDIQPFRHQLDGTANDLQILVF